MSQRNLPSPLSGKKSERNHAIEQAFLDVLNETGKPVTTKQIAERSLADYNYAKAIHQHMRWLVQEGLVEHPDKHTWRLPAGAGPNGRRPDQPPEPIIPQTIRIDREVWRALQKLAVPFVDTPNDVLRRLLYLGNREE